MICSYLGFIRPASTRSRCTCVAAGNGQRELAYGIVGLRRPKAGRISVKGDDMHPLYTWLTSKAENGVEDSEVQWNFHKYLIDENGALVKNVAPTTSPVDAAILDWIQS